MEGSRALGSWLHRKSTDRVRPLSPGSLASLPFIGGKKNDLQCTVHTNTPTHTYVSILKLELVPPQETQGSH